MFVYLYICMFKFIQINRSESMAKTIAITERSKIRMDFAGDTSNLLGPLSAFMNNIYNPLYIAI